MIAAMETDSYWRTRCVGEAMDQGYTFLRLTCSCGRITDFPFPLLLHRRGVSRDTFSATRFSLPEVRQHIAAGRHEAERPMMNRIGNPDRPVCRGNQYDAPVVPLAF